MDGRGNPIYNGVVLINPGVDTTLPQHWIAMFHEGPGGHQALNAIAQRRYEKTGKEFEATVKIMNTPAYVIDEGIGGSPVALLTPEGLDEEVIIYDAFLELAYIGRNNASIMYHQEDKSIAELIKYLRNTCLITEKNAEKQALRTADIVKGGMYDPGYALGRLFVAQNIRLHGRENFILVGYGALGPVDVVTAPIKTAQLAERKTMRNQQPF